MKRRILVAGPLLVLVALAAWLVRPRREVIGQAYVSARTATLWDSRAQVHEAVTTVRFGDKVDIVSRRGDQARVRTAAGATGWVDAQALMEPGLWQRSEQLLEKARSTPVQARGRTKVPTNVRVEPGRSAPRLYQFNRGATVEVVARAVADWTQNSEEKEGGGEQEEVKKEDWFLVRGTASRRAEENALEAAEGPAAEGEEQGVPVAGWVVARFVELDLPDAIREGALASGMRVLAWFELNRVQDPSGEMPQYLAAGTRGPEGQPCDFTMLRVYTWSKARERYETAYMESDLCGQLPVRVSKFPGGGAEFRFAEMGGASGSERMYRLRQTIVRRVGGPGGRELRAGHGFSAK